MKNNLPEVGELLTARPENMDFETYKRDLKNQNKRMRKRRNGFTVWYSNGVPELDNKGKQVFIDIEGVKIPSWITRPMKSFTGDTKQLPVL